MQFQILNNNGQALTMGELDKEAAAFFGVKINDEFYVGPKGPSPMGNWFENIGGSISKMTNGKHEWSHIIGQICGVASIGETSVVGVLDSIKYYAPYIDLCLHWKAKGYIPVSC